VHSLRLDRTLSERWKSLQPCDTSAGLIVEVFAEDEGVLHCAERKVHRDRDRDRALTIRDDKIGFGISGCLGIGVSSFHQWPRKLCSDSTTPKALIGDEDTERSGGTLLEFH
jgi:hypothetical protein